MFSGRLHFPKWMIATAFVGGLMGSTILSPISGWAQDTITPIAPSQAALPPQYAPPPAAPIFTQAQLESMLAPIALYPDSLLSSMLMAAAYPQEVAAADQWVHEGADASLRGDALNAALAPVDWDPSVKSLVPFPQVLDTMAQHMDWTLALGQAFVAQQADVMNVVQGLRQRALADGDLRSTPQLVVASAGGIITIEPASPEMVYVPVYNPAIVYGTWTYPEPPFALYPSQVYAAPIIFGVGFAIVHPLWGWNHWDWAHRRVFVEPARVNVINARLIAEGHRERIADRDWHVDRSHERGRPAEHAAAVAPHPQVHGGPAHAAAVAPHPQPHGGPAHATPGSHGPHSASVAAPHAAPPHHGPTHPTSAAHPAAPHPTYSHPAAAGHAAPHGTAHPAPHAPAHAPSPGSALAHHEEHGGGHGNDHDHR